jgi:hypothetical protein
MPWRLIGFIVFFGIFLAFIGFNLENRCDISFGFATIQDVPVFLSSFVSFVLGILWVIPFIVSFQLKKSKAAKSKEPGPSLPDSPEKPKRPWGRKDKTKASPAIHTGSYEGDDSSYGID